MTIKDIELLTGIPKANIRFYESEGLIKPERKENGYRIYDMTHVATLKRIRLFRALDIPIETIKDLATGSITLEDALDAQMIQFAEQHNRLITIQKIIQSMLESCESYDSIDVDVYINMLENEDKHVIKQDVNPKLNLPWRRFWARTLDFSIYHLILFLLLPNLFEGNGMIIIRYVLDLLLFITIESVSLACVGTTIGKLIFGISVTDLNGKRLTIENAVKRTALVTQHGLGFNFPFLSQYLQWQSLKSMEEGNELPWESESEINYRDNSNWRYILFSVLIIPMALFPLLNGSNIATKGQEQVELIDETFPQTNDHTDLLFNAVRESYRVSEVVYSAEGNYEIDELPILVFDNSVLRFSYNGSCVTNDTIDTMEEIGTFEHVPSENNSSAVVWKLTVESAPEITYIFYLDNDCYYLEYYKNSHMEWRWKLVEAEILKVRLYSKHAEKSRYPSWWKVGTFDVSYIYDHVTHLRYPITMNLIFQEQDIPDNIVIREEFYSEGDKICREHSIIVNEKGQFPLDIPLPDLDGESFSIFYIPYEGGEYVICFTYEPGGETWDAFMYDL